MKAKFAAKGFFNFVGFTIKKTLARWFREIQAKYSKDSFVAPEEIHDHPIGVESYLPHINFVNGRPVSVEV
jgi:hypothetical protein